MLSADSVEAGEPTLRAGAPSEVASAWRWLEEGRTYWVVLETTAAYALLENVLGGPPAASLTTIERTILSEIVTRLVAAADESVSAALQPESAQSLRPLEQMWYCEMRLRLRIGSDARLQLLTPTAPAPPRKPIRLVDVTRLYVTLTGSVDAGAVALAALRGLRPGSTLSIGRAALLEHVQLHLDGQQIGRGALGVVEAKRAVRVRELHAGETASA